MLDEKDFSCEDYLRSCFAPPSTMPSWQWMEENIELGNDSPIPGKYRTDIMPMIRTWCEYNQDPYVRLSIAMVSAQSAKTQTAVNEVCRDVKEDPATTMWVMSSLDACEEFAKKRLFPALENCKATAGLVPKDRTKRSKKLIQFPGMNLILRGSNSRAGLQSDPVRRIFCDERREWAKGAIHLLRKRTRAFHNAIEISMGVAGVKGDDLHEDFKKGSQTFCHWNCLECGHSQPFRFGRKATVLFENPRERGGVIWETNETTKPGGGWIEEGGVKVYKGGIWDFEEVKKTVRYQCEQCGRNYRNAEKLQLLKSYHPKDYNPKAARQNKSIHWNALYMPWPSCDWASIAVEFLEAIEAARLGNLEPLKAFVTETLGEPFEETAFFTGEKTMIASDYKIGHSSLKRGEFWELEHRRYMGVDKQLDHYWYVIRAFAQNGASRYVSSGKLSTWEHVREAQVNLEVPDGNTYIDFGYKMREAGEQCCIYGWRGMRGDDDEKFPHKVGDLKVSRVYSTPQSFDPFLGKQTQPRKWRFAAWVRWSNPSVKDYLGLLQTGKGHYFGIPSDVNEVYLKQMDGERKKDGKWVPVGSEGEHCRDCECMILVGAIGDGLLSGTSSVKPPAKKEEEAQKEAA